MLLELGATLGPSSSFQHFHYHVAGFVVEGTIVAHDTAPFFKLLWNSALHDDQQEMTSCWSSWSAGFLVLWCVYRQQKSSTSRFATLAVRRNRTGVVWTSELLWLAGS